MPSSAEAPIFELSLLPLQLPAQQGNSLTVVVGAQDVEVCVAPPVVPDAPSVHLGAGAHAGGLVGVPVGVVPR